jgi:ribosomal protein S18 acetylase RimI-like enzyme
MLGDALVEFRRGDLVITTDRRAIDPDAVLALLRGTAWARAMSRATLERAAANSVCFTLLDDSRLAGFARAVTDLSTYAYLTDVVVADSHRGRGLGRWLVECALAHPELQGLRRVALITRSATGLYERLGFGTDTGEATYMERRPPRPGANPG